MLNINVICVQKIKKCLKFLNQIYFLHTFALDFSKYNIN